MHEFTRALFKRPIKKKYYPAESTKDCRANRQLSLEEEHFKCELENAGSIDAQAEDAPSAIKYSVSNAPVEQPLSIDQASLGRLLRGAFATLQPNYRCPKYPIVLCHGFLGFDRLEIGGIPAIGVPPIAQIQYWNGISEPLLRLGAQVLVTKVPPAATIAERAELLGRQIEQRFKGMRVNLIAHSMGGLDARELICNKPTSFEVASLTMVSTPHRGSAYADYIISFLGDQKLRHIERMVKPFGLDSVGALEQLTSTYMAKKFNPTHPDDPNVKYYSYGAMIKPSWLSTFQHSWQIINKAEGPNDGLVSVRSANWGDSYQGTLVGVDHLELMNWTNSLERSVLRLRGERESFNAIAFFLKCAENLADDGF